MDGSGGARTAWMWQPWNRNTTEVDGTNTGYPAADPDTMRVTDPHVPRRGHARRGAFDRRPGHRLDHGELRGGARGQADQRDFATASSTPTSRPTAPSPLWLGCEREYDAAYPEPSATFTWYIGDVYAPNFGARSQRLNPFATFERNGIIWANGSDLYVTPFPARYGIWAAIARETLLPCSGRSVRPRRGGGCAHGAPGPVTIWAAHQMFLEKKIGSIEVGKYADLAVWDRDPYTVPTADIKEMQCEMTVFNGKVVFEK